MTVPQSTYHVHAIAVLYQTNNMKASEVAIPDITPV